MLPRFSLVCALVLLGATPSLDHSVDALVTEHRTPSISVAIVNHGKITYTHTDGAAGANTAYAVGSVTKMVTAVSIFQLVDRGLISIDDPVSKYLPTFPHASEITLRQLLGHRSGIPNYGDIAIINGEEYHPISPAGLIDLFASKSLDFAPGTKWAYSNSGYVLLGRIVERVSHQSLETYEMQHIFAPLQMKQTDVGRARVGTTLAAPYYVGDGARMYMKLAPGELSWYYACGDIVSTASDLARFDIGLMDGKLVKPATFALMQKIMSTDTIAKGWSDGLGIFTRTLAGRTLIGHHGGEPGYTADNELIPADGFAAVVLDNGMASTDAALKPMIESVYGTAPATPGPAADFNVADAEQRFLAFYIAVEQAKLDHSTLTTAMDKAMTSESTKGLADVFTSWGPFAGITSVEQTKQGEFNVYGFTIMCKDGRHNVNFTLDAAKRVAGIFFP